jgi:GntR family transcriptional regulator/MocR family aminotransferase
MPKRATVFDLVLPPRETQLPAYRWLYQALRSAVLSGRLRSGTRLPATRDLAQQYRLSRGTIVNAFELLKSEGYLQGTIGSGTYVSKVLPEALLHVARESQRFAPAQNTKTRRLSDYAQRLELFSNLDARPARAFRPNLPALDLFPTTLWAQVAARRLRRVSTRLLLACDPLGYQPLRHAIADYLSTSRGVNCLPEQVAIVSGVQEALDLVSRIFVDPGDRVCLENPGYPGALFSFAASGAKIVPMPVDDAGIEVNAAKLRDARLVYVTPGHQFPLGVTMGLARRLQLLEWARKSGGLILEDDYDSDYRYSGRPVPALQGLDRHGSVIFTGSFSKILFPSLRLGYIVIPSDLLDRFSAAISTTSRHASLLEQAILCDFITEGHFARHHRRMRQIYAERVSTLVASARKNLAGLFELSPMEAGLQTSGFLSQGITGEAAAAAAAKREVEVTPLSRFFYRTKSRPSKTPKNSLRSRPAPEGLQLGFAAVDPKEIRRGVEALAHALESCLKSRDPRV